MTRGKSNILHLNALHVVNKGTGKDNTVFFLIYWGEGGKQTLPL